MPLCVELALDHDLRGDAGVVGARLPQRVVAPHAVVADQRVHQGVLEGVAHVQRAGDVGRRQHDAVGVGLPGSVGGLEIAVRFPQRVPVASMAAGSKLLASSMVLELRSNGKGGIITWYSRRSGLGGQRLIWVLASWQCRAVA